MSAQKQQSASSKSVRQRSSRRSDQFRIGKVQGYLRGSVWYLYYHEQGQRRRPRVGSDLEVARQMAAQINGQLEVGAPAALSFEPISLVELRDRWLSHHEHVLRSSVSSINRYRTATEHLLRYVQSVKPVKLASHFHTSHAEDFVRYLRTLRVSPNGHPHSAKRPLLDKGIQYILETCRTLFNYAMKRRHLSPYAENPFTALELGRLPIEHVRRIVRPTSEQQVAFLKACDQWQFPVYLTLMLTGLRPGELVHLLLPEDLDFEQRLLFVRNRINLGWQVKTRNERAIPLLPCLAEILRRLVIVGMRAPGVALTYPLSGLVVCGSCGRAMIASSTSPYVTLSGEERKYVSYVCRASRSGGGCDNSCHVPEGWLRETVITLVRRRLFLEKSAQCDESSESPNQDANDRLRERILNSPAFAVFMTQVQQALDQMKPETVLHETALEKEKADLNIACRGWRLSLGDPDLDLEVRNLLQGDLANARQRIVEIERAIDEIRSTSLRTETAIDREAVVDRLVHLSDLLSRDCASATNLMLAQHIDSIRCFPDGKVIVRNCHLGALANPLDFCGSMAKPPSESLQSDSDYVVTGRRRTRRRISVEFEEEEQIRVANDFAVDPTRFGGLAPEWFTEDVYLIPRQMSWAEEHAMKVAEYRIETHATMQVTASRFSKTIPTLREALKYARDVHGVNAFGKEISVPTRAFWPRDNAEAVAEFFRDPGVTMKQAQMHFGKSQPWISMARKIAREQSESQKSTDSAISGSHSPLPQSEQRDCA